MSIDGNNNGSGDGKNGDNNNGKNGGNRKTFDIHPKIEKKLNFLKDEYNANPSHIVCLCIDVVNWIFEQDEDGYSVIGIKKSGNGIVIKELPLIHLSTDKNLIEKICEILNDENEDED